MFPISTVANKRKTATQKPGAKIDEKQSKDIMNSLFEDLDQQNDEELEQQYVAPENAIIAFSKEEELALKYNVTVPEKVEVAANPFSKKRPISEISQPSEIKA